MKVSKVTLACLLAASSIATTHAMASDLSFFGYGRFHGQYSDQGAGMIGAEGQASGNAAGRLGNEGSGGEFGLSQRFDGANGSEWRINMLMEDWGGGPGLARFSAEGTGVLASQPNATVWAGREHNGRVQHDLNDYFSMMNDGQGAGVKNLELAGVQFDSALIADGGANGNYAATFRAHGIDLAGFANLELFANAGFAEHGAEIGDGAAEQAYQLATKLGFGPGALFVRYGHNADNGVFWKTEGLTTLFATYEGGVELSPTTSVNYLVSYHNIENGNNSLEDRTTYSAIVRPMQQWNDTHSTWFEAGYAAVDWADAGEMNSAWKMTLSQNIAVGANSWSRPMLRFHVSAGQEDNRVHGSTDKDNNIVMGTLKEDAGKQAVYSVGATFEAWW